MGRQKVENSLQLYMFESKYEALDLQTKMDADIDGKAKANSDFRTLASYKSVYRCNLN